MTVIDHMQDDPSCILPLFDRLRQYTLDGNQGDDKVSIQSTIYKQNATLQAAFVSEMSDFTSDDLVQAARSDGDAVDMLVKVGLQSPNWAKFTEGACDKELVN